MMTSEQILEVANSLNAEATAFTEVLKESYDKYLHEERDLVDSACQLMIKLSKVRFARERTLARPFFIDSDGVPVQEGEIDKLVSKS